MKIKYFFILILILSCSKDKYSEENLQKIVSSYNSVNTEIWEISNLKLDQRKKLDLFNQNNCYEILVSYEINQKKDCYLMEEKSILENNFYINKIKKALSFNTNMEIFKKDNCYTKIELDKELNNIILSEKKKVGSYYCIERNNILFGNNCIKEKVYTEKDFFKNKEKIISNYNNELKNLKKIKNKNFKMKNELYNVCEKDGKLINFKY